MHAPLLHKPHLFDQRITFVKQHQKFAATILILAIIGVAYSAADYSEPGYALKFGRIPNMPDTFAGSFTRLTDPAYADEYIVRKAYITNALEQLLHTSGVERTYAAVYKYKGSLFGQGREARIAKVFEVSQAYIAPRFGHFTGMSRWNWLLSRQDDLQVGTLFGYRSLGDGFELHDDAGTPIGYIGFERKQGDNPFQDWEIAQLRETAAIIEGALLQSLDSLEQPSL